MQTRFYTHKVRLSQSGHKHKVQGNSCELQLRARCESSWKNRAHAQAGGTDLGRSVGITLDPPPPRPSLPSEGDQNSRESETILLRQMVSSPVPLSLSALTQLVDHCVNYSCNPNWRDLSMPRVVCDTPEVPPFAATSNPVVQAALSTIKCAMTGELLP